MDWTGSDGLDVVNVPEVAGRDDETDHNLIWIRSDHRLVSGLMGLNVVLLGAALVSGNVLNPTGLRHQEPLLFLMVLMGLSLLWMLWYLLWARRQPGSPPDTDHHSGSATDMVALMLFAGFSLLLCMFRMGYYLLLKECQPLVKLLLPFMQVPFFILQTYLLWDHSKDCIHKHKDLNRFGLMITLCVDLLLWLCAVTDDSVHLEIELEKQVKDAINSTLTPQEAGQENGTLCQCSGDAVCMTLRKGYEILYPFNMEFSLLAGCKLYVMWKNVGRHITSINTVHAQKSHLLSVLHRVLPGSLLGLLVLLSGTTVFVLYHVWVEQYAKCFTALKLFYCFHLGLIPTMALCSLAGLVVQKQGKHYGKQSQTKEKKENRYKRWVEEQGGSQNPARNLDVTLLVGAAVGQMSLAYLSFVAALALRPNDIVSKLDLSYSLLSLVELVLQNIFIIKGLNQSHVYPHKYVHSPTHLCEHQKTKGKSFFSKTKKEVNSAMGDELQEKNDTSVTPTVKEGHSTHHWNRRVIQEICAFLVLANITLWVIPAFGANPELESGLGKKYFGFSIWFVLMNLCQPLFVFYRMHAVGALMEILISA